MDKHPQQSRLAEHVVRKLTTLRGSSLNGRAQRFLYSRLRKTLARQEIYTRLSLGGSEILVPLAHDLPLIRSHHPQYSANVGRICRYIADQDPTMSVIDIGANIGDTAAILREFSSAPILCIEPDPHYFHLLKSNLERAKIKDVEIAQAFIATYTGEVQGKLSSGAGSGHFTDAADAKMQTQKLSDLLQRFPRFEKPRLLKIDTDGFDCSILRSELAWLAQVQPVVFFEYDPFFFASQPYDGRLIFNDLASAGYSNAIFYDNVGDYLLSLDLNRDRVQVDDLQSYFVGRGGHEYLDVAVFHERDRELAASISTKERTLATQTREQAAQTIQNIYG